MALRGACCRQGFVGVQALGNLEIGAGLGDFAGKVWRIGLMGYSARMENIELLLASLAEAMQAQGYDCDAQAALAAARAQA